MKMHLLASQARCLHVIVIILISFFVSTQMKISFDGRLVKPVKPIVDAPAVRDDDSIPLASRRPTTYNKWLKEPKLFQMILNTIIAHHFNWTNALNDLRRKDPVVFAPLSISTMQTWFEYDKNA